MSNQSRLSPCVLMRVDERSGDVGNEREREIRGREEEEEDYIGNEEEPNTKDRSILFFSFIYIFFSSFPSSSFLSKGINTAAERSFSLPFLHENSGAYRPCQEEEGGDDRSGSCWNASTLFLSLCYFLLRRKFIWRPSTPKHVDLTVELYLRWQWATSPQ